MLNILRDKRNIIYGVCLCFVSAFLAIYLSKLIGVNLLGFEKSPLSPIIFAILLGLIINNFNSKIIKLEPGFKFCIQYLLKLGIIFLGIRHL